MTEHPDRILTSDGTRPAQEAAAAEIDDGADSVLAPEDARVMSMLEEHVPLSLLVDLATRTGPDSKRILDDEGLPDDAWWDRPPAS